MNLFSNLFGAKSSEIEHTQEGLYQARFAPNFILKETPEQYDSNLLQIPLERIYLYKDKVNEIKAYEKDHLRYSKETFAFRDSLIDSLNDKDEFQLYIDYIERRGIKNVVLYDTKMLRFSMSKIHKYEIFFNLLTHYIETFGPNSKRAKDQYISIINDIDNIYEWELFYNFKLSNGCHLEKRKECAQALMKYGKCTSDIHTKIGTEKNELFKTIREYSEDSITFVYSKECLSIMIYKKDISKEIAGSVAYGLLDVFYYGQFGVVFLTFKFLDMFSFTHYINIKEFGGEEWSRSNTNKVEVWLIDRIDYNLKAWTRFELNALPTIKRCAFIRQRESTKNDITKNANNLLNKYSNRDFIKLSVFKERIFSDS